MSRLLASLAVGGGAGWLYVVWARCPEELSSQVFFFTPPFLTLFALFALLAGWINRRLARSAENTTHPLPQGGLWAAVVLLAAVPRSVQALNLWHGLLLVGLVVATEAALLGRR